jgi:hypothetical protein
VNNEKVHAQLAQDIITFDEDRRVFTLRSLVQGGRLFSRRDVNNEKVHAQLAQDTIRVERG